MSLLIRGATVIDGTGAPPGTADIAVSEGRITAIGRRLDLSAGDTVEAAGLCLAPGFIDIHGHSDMTHFSHPGAESKLFQGVTLEVTGNCGLSLFPVERGKERELAGFLSMHDFKLSEPPFGWNDFPTYCDTINSLRPGLNLAPLVGHGTLRLAAMGLDDRRPAPEELARMCVLLDDSLERGAWGLSTGLIYPPGCFAAMAELVTLAETVARHGALYASHIRNEGEGISEALEEAVAVGRASGAKIQVSHLKAMGKNRGESSRLLARLRDAREDGVDIAADQYPYAASATTLSAVVPAWAHEGGLGNLLDRLRNRELLPRLHSEIAALLAAREGAGRIIVTGCRSPEASHLSGLSIAEIASRWSCTPEEAVVRMVVIEEGRAGAIFHSMDEADVRNIIADAIVAVGSDGHGMTADAEAGVTHPRSYGTFPRILGRYVRDERLLPLEQAIRKMTSVPASRLGLTDRGIIRVGAVADLVVFDPATINDTAGFDHPHRYASGIVHLLVNGEPVISDGRLTGARPGRVLLRNVH